MNNKMNKLIVTIGALGLSTAAFAQSEPPAVVDYSSLLSDVSTTAAPIVGGLIALGAGIFLYKKLRGLIARAN